MFEGFVSLIFLVVGCFTLNPQLLIAAGAFAIAEQLDGIRKKGSVDDGRKE